VTFVAKIHEQITQTSFFFMIKIELRFIMVSV